MRIDVALEPGDIDADLDRLYQRMRTPGDALHRMAKIPMARPGFAFSYREVSGEFFVYVEDLARHKLAGCVVFNRAFEVDRKAERYLRSPHTRFGSGYRRQGLATAVYAWALQAGLCLISGPRQSVGAYRLWQSLAGEHELHYVQLRDKQLHCLIAEPEATALDDFETRMLLLGDGWNLTRFAGVTQCRLPETASLAMH